MSRLYHIEIARHAAGVDLKWVDNLLSHYSVPGVEGGRQGVARKITVDGVYHVALIARLSREMGMSVSRAVAMAGRLLESESARASIGFGLELRVDRRALEAEIDHLVNEAVEASTPPRRGRPPRREPREVHPKTTGRLE
jgi:hypothetical protein